MRAGRVSAESGAWRSSGARMRHVAAILVVASAMLASAGCAAIHGLDDYTTVERSGVAPGTDAGTTTPPTDGGPTGCQSHQECNNLAATSSSGGATASKPAPTKVCVRATGKCESLVSEDCPRVTGDATKDGAVVIGTLLGDTGASALEQAAFLAAEEISPSRPLVVVGCNAGGNLLRATKHLAETLHAAAVIGPVSGEQVVEVTQQVSAKAGTLLMTPTSPVSAISNLADGDLTWRATPSDAQRAKLVIQQLEDLQSVLRATRGLTTVKLGIVHPTDALGTSARDAISGKLILNGRFINDAANATNASIDAYETGNTSALSAIATKYAVTFKPDIVFITSAEQMEHVILPLEQALTAARAVARPYYVLTDSARTAEVLSLLASPALPADIRRRVRGVGVKPDTSSTPVLEDFRAAFTARYGEAPPEPAAAMAYDATYAIAYAVPAAASPSGASVAQGLRALAVGTPAAVGAKGLTTVMGNLANGKSVALRGTFGLMQWDASGDITGGTVEVWCVGSVAGAPAFGSSGLTMDVQTQVVGGAFVQCQ